MKLDGPMMVGPRDVAVQATAKWAPADRVISPGFSYGRRHLREITLWHFRIWNQISTERSCARGSTLPFYLPTPEPLADADGPQGPPAGGCSRSPRHVMNSYSSTVNAPRAMIHCESLC